MIAADGLDSRPRSKLARQHALRRIFLCQAARFDQVEHGAQNVASEVVFAAAFPVKEWFDKLPFGVRQVGAMAFSHGSGESR